MTETITVTITATQGSAPRDAGTFMQVSAGHIDGTIGGGALEWEAIGIARAMIRDGLTQAERTFPLGPDLGQCCGGRVTLQFSAEPGEVLRTATPLWIWGAGHVGRAVASVLAPLQDRLVTLVDDHADRLPAQMAPAVQPFVAKDMVLAVRHAPSDADHIILTYSHDIDLALCDALLRRGFATCGLIGSATKWARFQRRLVSMGHSNAEISRIACPIGDPGLGKHPQAIAVGVVAALLSGEHAQA